MRGNDWIQAARPCGISGIIGLPLKQLLKPAKTVSDFFPICPIIPLPVALSYYSNISINFLK